MRSHKTIDLSAPPHGLLKGGPNQLFALFDRPELAARAIDALATAGHDTTGSWLLSGAEGADRLDASGRRHGLLGRLYRLVEHIGDEHEGLLRYDAHLRSGGTALNVPVTHDEVAAAAKVLGTNGAYGMIHFDRNHWEAIGGTAAAA